MKTKFLNKAITAIVFVILLFFSLLAFNNLLYQVNNVYNETQTEQQYNNSEEILPNLSGAFHFNEPTSDSSDASYMITGDIKYDISSDRKTNFKILGGITVYVPSTKEKLISHSFSWNFSVEFSDEYNSSKSKRITIFDSVEDELLYGSDPHNHLFMFNNWDYFNDAIPGSLLSENALHIKFILDFASSVGGQKEFIYDVGTLVASDPISPKQMIVPLILEDGKIEVKYDVSSENEDHPLAEPKPIMTSFILDDSNIGPTIMAEDDPYPSGSFIYDGEISEGKHTLTIQTQYSNYYGENIKVATEDVVFDYVLALPFELKDEYFTIDDVSNDSVTVSMDYTHDDNFQDYKTGTLKAKANEEELTVQEIITSDSTRDSLIHHTFIISGLDESTTYSSDNAIQISVNGVDWIKLPEITTTKLPGNVNSSPIYKILLALLILLLLIILILIILDKNRIKIKWASWTNENESLIIVNNKNKVWEKKLSIENKDGSLKIFNTNKDGSIQKIESEILNLEEDKASDGIKIVLKNLNDIELNKLQFETLANKDDEHWFTDWKKIYGKIKPYRDEEIKKQAKRDNILSKSNATSDIKIREVYGVGPKIEKHFNKNGYNDVDEILKQKNYIKNNREFIEELPSLKGVTYESKLKKVENIIDELKYLKKEIDKK